MPETVYLATDRETALQRVADRAAGHGDDFQLSAELAAAYFDHFEVPTAAEGPLTVMGPPGPRPVKIKSVISNGPWLHPDRPPSRNRGRIGETGRGPPTARPARGSVRSRVIAAP